MEIELIAATVDQEPVLIDLLDSYMRELGPLFNLEPPKDGRFSYPDLPLYWTDPQRHPFLARVGGELAGFALIRRVSNLSSGAAVWDMTEFFVVSALRKQGAGTRIAHEVWRRFEGRWEVRVLRSNTAAMRFWEKAAKAYARDRLKMEDFDSNGRAWTMISF